MNDNETNKLECILEKFNITSFKQGINKMNNIITHVMQENYDIDETKIIPFHDIINEVYERMQKGEYKRPNVSCKHFAYFGGKIANYFNKKVGIILCNPEHVGGRHYMLDDGKKYYDPSVYKSIRIDKKWIPTKESGIKITNIPSEFVNSNQQFLFFDEETKNLNPLKISFNEEAKNLKPLKLKFKKETKNLNSLKISFD